ncbi:MAG: RNA polymerase sigma-70 factor [Cytophagaceae bacterium]|nr:RNA polymerase sigma-70 factor [Cytophagaceae bacterium]
MKALHNYDDNAILIDHLKKGEEKAYIFLLDKYHRRLFAYALTFVNDHALAEDIVQNVFLRTWQFHKKLNCKYAIQSFLYRSVYNEFISTYRRDKAAMVLELKYYETMNEVVEEMDDRKFSNILEIVTREIEKLPPKCRQVFTMSKQEGLTNKEISEYLDISIKTVEAQITKGFNILRKSLGDKYETVFLLIFGKRAIG